MVLADRTPPSVFKPDPYKATRGSPANTNDAILTLRRKLTWDHPDNSTEGRAFLMVYAGRISHEKGLMFCVQLLDALNQQEGNTNFFLCLVGDGPQRDEYAALHGSKRGLYFRPKFVDQKEVATHYCAADAYISGSEFESLGKLV